MRLCVCALFAVSAFAAFTEDKLPDAPGKVTYIKVCGDCHGPDVVTGMGHDRSGWKDIVEEMVDKGATATPAEMKEIVDYLVKAFPKLKRGLHAH